MPLTVQMFSLGPKVVAPEVAEFVRNKLDEVKGEIDWDFDCVWEWLSTLLQMRIPKSVTSSNNIVLENKISQRLVG